MSNAIDPGHPLHRLFRGLTEHTFATELGIADPSLVGYVADLLVRFVPSEAVWARDAQGRRLAGVVDLLAQAEAGPDDRRAACHRHVGDFALFWSGVYPEALPRLQADAAGLDVRAQGKRSYDLAGAVTPGALGPVLRRLSVEFEACADGLRRVRREWEART